MLSHFRFICRLLMLVGLGLGSAGAAVLPSQLTGLQTADAAMNGIGQNSPVDRMARAQGIACSEYGLYHYQNAAAATQGLNGWLLPAGFAAQAVPTEDPVVVQWKASRGTTQLYGAWIAADVGSPRGMLQLCAGKLVPTQTATADTGTHTRVRIPLWAIVALGSAIAGGATRSIHKNPFSPD